MRSSPYTFSPASNGAFLIVYIAFTNCLPEDFQAQLDAWSQTNVTALGFLLQQHPSTRYQLLHLAMVM